MSSLLSYMPYQFIYSPFSGKVRGGYFRFRQSQTEIAYQIGLNQSTVSRIIQELTLKRASYHPAKLEIHSRKPIFTDQEVQAIERAFNKNRSEGKILNGLIYL